jgi:hypothetical protein
MIGSRVVSETLTNEMLQDKMWSVPTCCCPNREFEECTSQHPLSCSTD